MAFRPLGYPTRFLHISHFSRTAYRRCFGHPSGRDSLVSKATRYGLDSPGIESQ